MEPKPRLFMDTSAVFAGIWSAEGGARMLLKLGEAGVVELLVRSQVLEELEDVIRRKAARLLGNLALLLDRSQVVILPASPEELLASCCRLVVHPGDARILADAWHNQADYLVTLDKAHFLNSANLQEQVPFPIGTPGNCLAWLRKLWNKQENNP